MVGDLDVMGFVYKWQVRQQMIKPGNGGYNIGGDCEKGSGSRYCLGLCLSGSGRVSGSGDIGASTRKIENWQGSSEGIFKQARLWRVNDNGSQSAKMSFALYSMS
ncbi:hypothetical protein R8055_000455 [Escherichia coli]|nr:hypothetical protein [Escherichia coli]EHS0494775.1 hypothetical protein [Escherichia coli O26]HDR9899483.1 hypothetical protein [Escherichia coli C240-52 (9c)]EFA7392815.1 hypothetical protein [Escherichia coli]EFB9216659.1 hypothetical protein [Escherichia coli]EFF6321979.1 hypothetical protein [Escherichia coli]